MKIKLQKLNVPPIATIVLIYLLSAVVWFGSYFFYQTPYMPQGKCADMANDFIPFDSLIAHTITFIFVFINSIVLSQMNRKFSFIRTRSFYPSFLYLLISSTWLHIHANYIGAVASFFMLIAFFLCLDMYKNRQAFEHAYLASFLFSLASLLVTDYLFIIPIFLFAPFILKANSLKVFLASLIGLATPWILYFSISFFFFNQTYHTDDIVVFFLENELFNHMNFSAVVYSTLLLVMVVISTIQTFSNWMKDSIQARNQFSFIILLGFALIFLSLFRFNNYSSILFTIIFYFAIQLAYPFALVKNKINPILFLLLLFSSFIFAVSMIVEQILGLV